MGKKKQLTIHELLEDPHYAKWITMEPKITVKGSQAPWFIYAKRKKKGPWSRAEAPSYAKALEWLQAHLDEFYDIVITSKRQAFRPFVIRVDGTRDYWPCPPGYIWCTYCRRPTKFRYFTHHHALPRHIPVVEYEKRCEVCGVRLKFIKRFSSKLRSRWADGLN